MSLALLHDTARDLAPAGRQQRLSLLLAVLYVLANVFPALHVLLPGDPASIVAGALPAAPAEGPTMWFPLAYALSGLPSGPAAPAPRTATQLHHRERVAPLLAQIVPALTTRPERCLDAPAHAGRLLRLPGPRPGMPALSIPDPPPRPPQVPARAPSAA